MSSARVTFEARENIRRIVNSSVGRSSNTGELHVPTLLETGKIYARTTVASNFKIGTSNPRQRARGSERGIRFGIELVA